VSPIPDRNQMMQLNLEKVVEKVKGGKSSTNISKTKQPMMGTLTAKNDFTTLSQSKDFASPMSRF
jgi:hypothetical protein